MPKTLAATKALIRRLEDRLAHFAQDDQRVPATIVKLNQLRAHAQALRGVA